MPRLGVPLGPDHDPRCYEMHDDRSLVLLCGRCGAVEPAERYFNALVVAAQLADGIGDTDLHTEAYNVYVERTGKNDGGDPSEEDYVEAFVRAVERLSSPQVRLKCTVRPGVFSSEWAVTLQSKEGPVSFFVDKTLVEVTQVPEKDREPVEGRIRVAVLERKPDSLLIRLPEQSASGTSSVWVSTDLLG